MKSTTFAKCRGRSFLRCQPHLAQYPCLCVVRDEKPADPRGEGQIEYLLRYPGECLLHVPAAWGREQVAMSGRLEPRNRPA
jgi:hypothetical protein